MRGQPGKGAEVGFVCSLLLVALMFLPTVIEGDDYEITDPLVFFALPFVVMGTGIGALIGAKGPPASGAQVDGRRRSRARTITLVVAGAAVVVAVWTILWATGFVDTGPLGID